VLSMDLKHEKVQTRLGSIRLDIARVQKFLISFGTLHFDGW
jgi:hypothetical protein